MKETYLKISLGDSDNDGKADLSMELCILGFVVPFKPSVNLNFGSALGFITDLFSKHHDAAIVAARRS